MMIKEILTFCGTYSIKNMKLSKRQESWFCSLYENNKLLGEVVCGGLGMVEFYIEDKEALTRLRSYSRTKYFEADPEAAFVAKMVDYMDTICRLKKACKKQTMIILKDNIEIDEFGVHTVYHVLNLPFDNDVKSKFLKLNPYVELFLNEELNLLINKNDHSQKNIPKKPKLYFL